MTGSEDDQTGGLGGTVCGEMKPPTVHLLSSDAPCYLELGRSQQEY
jgi:hypothetical protein